MYVTLHFILRESPEQERIKMEDVVRRPCEHYYEKEETLILGFRNTGTAGRSSWRRCTNRKDRGLIAFILSGWLPILPACNEEMTNKRWRIGNLS
ncbi:hypothetical protein INR49_024566, partial [Caranx melampygus]